MNAAAEQAIASYVRGHYDPSADQEQNGGELDVTCNRSGVLECLPVHEGRITQNRAASSIVVAASASENQFDFQSWNRTIVEVTLYTHRHEDEQNATNPAALHRQRFEALQALLYDTQAIKAWVNDTANRERGGYPIYTQAVWPEPADGKIDGDTFFDRFPIGLYCQPLNVPATP